MREREKDKEREKDDTSWEKERDESNRAAQEKRVKEIRGRNKDLLLFSEEQNRVAKQILNPTNIYIYIFFIYKHNFFTQTLQNVAYFLDDY